MYQLRKHMQQENSRQRPPFQNYHLSSQNSNKTCSRRLNRIATINFPSLPDAISSQQKNWMLGPQLSHSYQLTTIFLCYALLPFDHYALSLVEEKNKKKKYGRILMFFFFSWIWRENREERKEWMWNPPKIYFLSINLEKTSGKERICLEYQFYPYLYISILYQVKDKQFTQYDSIFFLFTFLFNQARKENIFYFLSLNFLFIQAIGGKIYIFSIFLSPFSFILFFFFLFSLLI